DWLRELLDWRSMDVALADDMAALPGLNDIGRLLEVEAWAAAGDFDAIVVDGPPLGHCLDLLSALDAAARWLDRLFPVRQPTVFEPFLRALTGVAPSADDVYEHGRDLLLRLARLRDLLTDPEVASIRIVLAADRSALAEVQGALAVLSLFAYPADAAIVNRLLPPEVSDPFFEAARAEQQEVLSYIQASVAPMPVLASPLLSTPPDALAGLAAALYGQQAPAAVLYRGPVHAFSQRDGRHLLSLALPFARREELSLEQVGDNLIVQLAGRRRTIPLPQEVRYLDALSSSFDGQSLHVSFGRSSAGENAR
ncbi:MAG: ArsA family ATPase, partial [Chloroflexi bacterium]|nr:ArsA family ATPase [Chloroflexota bacterium]